MKKLVLFLLFLLTSLSCFPVRAYALAAVEKVAVPAYKAEKKTIFSKKKLRKLQRFVARWVSGHVPGSPEKYLWFGLFGLGLAVCLSFFSLTLGGIVAAASVACLIIGAIFKLSTL